MTMKRFAVKYRRSPQNLSQVTRGRRAPTDTDIAALIAELGGTDAEWRELFHQAGRPATRRTA